MMSVMSAIPIRSMHSSYDFVIHTLNNVYSDKTQIENIFDKLVLNENINYYVSVLQLKKLISNDNSDFIDTISKKINNVLCKYVNDIKVVFDQQKISATTFIVVRDIINECILFSERFKLLFSSIDNSINNHEYQNIFSQYVISKMINDLLSSKVYNDTTLLQLLDNDVSSNLCNVELIGKLIILMGKVIENGKIIKNDRFENIIFKNNCCSLKNVKNLLLIDPYKIPFEICKTFIEIFVLDTKFIQSYEINMKSRLLNGYTHDMIEFEIQFVSFIKNTIDLIKIDDNSNKSYIETMDIFTNRIKMIINDCSQSMVINRIVRHNLRVKNNTYKNVTIDTSKCHFNIYDGHLWNAQCNEQSIIENDNYMEIIKAYFDIFKKISDCNDKNICIDMRNSTSVLDLDISGKTYSFLVSFQQLSIVTSIIDNNELTFEQLQNITHINEHELLSIVSCLVDYEIIKCVDDVFSFNTEISFSDENISLLNINEYNDKYDEIMIDNIIGIIIKNKFKTIDEIITEYISINGSVNCSIIENIVKYLIHHEMIQMNNEIFAINDELVNNLDSILS